MTTVDELLFYSPKAEYGCFSNFSLHSFSLDGKVWQTSEHYFQAQKFVGTKYETKVRMAKGPMQAATLGRDRSYPLRRDWESVKEQVMYDALLAKFTQHKDIMDILVATGSAKLVEHTYKDAYWGDGGNGKGKNRLGILLMRLRAEFAEGKYPLPFYGNEGTE